MPKRSVEIRRMHLKDIDSVVKIEEYSFPSPWSYWIFFQELMTPQRYYLVAEEEGEVVGYAGMSWVLEEGHITTIAVRRDRRRHGIGSKLLAALIEKAKELDLKFLTLEVRESNVAAQKMYHKAGFVVEGRRLRYYQQPTEDAVIMTLYLKNIAKPQ